MALEVPEALLSDINNYLDYTWQDDARDRKTLVLIRSGMVYLNDKLGEPANYAEDGEPRTLLFDYVRYARDGATDVFEANYKSRILAMQNRRRVSALAKSAV
jgi:hypothetical protein